MIDISYESMINIMYKAKLCLSLVYYLSACLPIQINISVVYDCLHSVVSYLLRNFKKVKTLFL